MEIRENGAKLVKIGVGRKRQICLHAFLLADLVDSQICASTCKKLNVCKLKKIGENWKKNRHFFLASPNVDHHLSEEHQS